MVRLRLTPRLLTALAVPLIAVSALPAYAFEETSRYTEVDAGVHVPVLTKAPTLVTFVEAQYPAEAQKKGLTASVKLMITIGADGKVSEAIVTGPAGEGFDEAAAEAVKQFIFTPAEVDFAPAPVQVEYVYNFVLNVAPDAGVDVAPEALDAGAPAKLEGTLYARGTRGFVPSAIVSCDNDPGHETYSNEAGHFALETVSGVCLVRIVAADFELFTTKEPLEPGETKEVKYYVLPKITGLQTIVKDQKERKEVVRRTISRVEAQKIPGTFGDPIRVIQNFPGVARTPFGLGQLIVRGANPNQTLTFFDGVEIPLLFHLLGGPSVVNGEFLDKIDFFPGGFGARYGRAVGGVVDVSSRKGASDTWHGVAKVDILDASLFVEAPITDSISVAAAARRSYVDALLPLFLPKDPNGGSLLVLPAYWDYQVRLDVGGKKGEKLKDGQSQFSVFAFGSDDQLRVVATGGGRNRDLTLDTHTSFHRIIGGWSFKQGNTTFKLTPYLGIDLAKVNFGIAQLTANDYTAGIRADLGIDVNDWLTVRAGVDAYNDTLVGEAEIPTLSGVQYISFPGADPKVGKTQFNALINTFDGALYSEADFSVGKFTATPGIRLSHAYINGQVRDAVDPRLWARYQLFDSTSIKGSIGLYTQPPPGAQMQPSPLGNPNLGYERAFQSSIGVAQKFSDWVNLDLTGFYNRRYDNIVQPGETTVNPDGTTTITQSANKGLGRAYGLEVMLRHEVSKYFFGWIAYTLNRSEERRAGTTNAYEVSTFDQTHILTAVGSVNLPWGFTLGARFRYVTGRPKSALMHDFDIYQADSNGYSGQFGPARASRIKDFHQLDIRIDKDFVFKSWTLTAYLDIQNVYNAQNVEASFFDYRFRVEYEVPGIPFLPVIGLKARL
ncbi:MAG: TonB family protein [Myxococcaceae bacterium]